MGVNWSFSGLYASPLLFNIVIQLLLDILEKQGLQSSAAGYHFSSLKDCSLLSSAYAEDIEIVTSSPKENQALLYRTDDFLKSTETMKARPNKCWSVALRRFETKEGENGLSGYRQFDPNLQISKEPPPPPPNTWMMEIFAILDDPPMYEAVKNLLVLKSRPN